MDNTVKCEKIREWIDPEERVTVDFLDEKDLNAMVTGCTTEHVDLALQTHFPHLKQTLCIPLSDVSITEDPSHYTRDPEKPLQHERLKLVINTNRPQGGV